MSFDYEVSVWGKGTAGLSVGDPTGIRLHEAMRALNSLRSGDKVLEVGCGAGQFIRAIKKLRPEFECYGSDISKTAIDLAKENSDGVLYSEQIGNNFAYADGVFSAVVIFDVLEHVDDPSQFLNEVNRVLGRGGKLYAFVPCEGDWLSIWHLLRNLNIAADLTKKFAGHIQYFSRRSLVEVVKSNGFRVSSLSYSEHFLGQLLGITAFFSMSRASKKAGDKQINNETYFTANLKKDNLKWLRKFVNSLVYFESLILRRVPSPNVHLVAEKI